MRPLCIEAPEQFAPTGAALAAVGIGVTLVDRSMKVCWANDLVREQAVMQRLTCRELVRLLGRELAVHERQCLRRHG